MSRNALSFEHELWIIKFKLTVALNLRIQKKNQQQQQHVGWFILNLLFLTRFVGENFSTLSNSSFNMAAILRIYFKPALLCQVITFTNRIWPDLAFGFVDKRSGYEIKLFSDVAIVVTYTPYLLDLSLNVRLCVKWMLCDVSFLEVPYSVMSVILYFRIGKSYWEQSTY